jgi:hypothetical protein
MAMFIARLLKKTKAGPGANTEYVSGGSGSKEIKSIDLDHNFTDLSATGLIEARNSIVNLWNLGATDVQSSTAFEPTLAMSRKSMATFMANALKHTNARPIGLVAQANGYRVKNGTPVKISVSHRGSDFAPIANSMVDAFQYQYSSDSTVTRFDSYGQCTAYVSATTGSNVKCQLDSSDPKTDADGNLAVISLSPPNTSKVDVWAWTSTPTTNYDNDLHASGASKITVETYNG